MDQKPSAGEFLDPLLILKHLDLKRGDHVADFGCGHGFFTIPLAHAVGGNGKVYAVDIQKEVLDIVRAKAQHENLLNIEFVRADLDQEGGSRLKDKYIDFVLVSNALFQFENKHTILKEAYRLLREGGRLAVIEWNETPALFGPPLPLRIKKETVKHMALEAGFEIEREFEAGSHHYGILFKK